MSAVDQNFILSLLVIVVFAIAIWKTFAHMKAGFGPFNTSVVIIILVLFVATTFVLFGKVEWQSVANLIFSIVGFAGGLLAKKAGKDTDE
jgi:anaerobic C4-dicarboxylate transporter